MTATTLPYELTFDDVNDIGYITFAHGMVSRSELFLNESIVLDFSDTGTVLGIEILSLSRAYECIMRTQSASAIEIEHLRSEPGYGARNIIPYLIAAGLSPSSSKLETAAA
jgi:uncharacterized protein YuzE